MYFNVNESVVGTNSAQTTDRTGRGGARATSSFGNLSVSTYWRQLVLLGGSGAGGLSFPNPLTCYDNCSGKYTLSTSFVFGQYGDGKILQPLPQSHVRRYDRPFLVCDLTHY